jgi:uncharacterized membrane protein YfcA
VSVVELIILLCGGGAAGFLAGFFGVGGGIILVPLLLLFYQSSGVSSLITTHLAFGTSLLIIVFASGSSTLRYSRNGLVTWKAVLYLCAGSILGGFGGSALASGMDGRTLRQIFAAIMLLSAIQLIGKIKKRKSDQTPDAFPPALVLSGAGVGFVSALAGVGGGVLAIPILHSIFRFPFKKALGTSSATIVITALAGVVGYVIQGWGNPSLPPYTLGFVDFLHAAPMIIGSIPLAVVGANVAQGTDPRRLTGIFAVLLVVVGLRLFFF